MNKQNSPFTLFQRIIQQDTGIHDPGAKRMILSVLSASLVTVVLLVILKINPEVMMLYGVLLVLALLFAQRGYLVPARLTIPLGGLIVFTYLMIHNKGIRDVALIGLPAVIIVAGLLFGKFGTLLYGILSVGVVIFLGVAESNGIIVNQFSVINSGTDYAAASIAVGIVAVMQWLVIDRLNENIKIAQRNAEAQREANEALRLSEARFRALIEESPQGIVISDEEGIILLANPFACQLLGYHERELIGTYALQLVDPEFLTQQPLPVDQLLAGNVIHRESILVCKNGDRVHVIGGNRYMPDGRYQYIFQDITKWKQAEAEREALIIELESKNAELEQFTYTVSHDLKSPLVTIRGFLGFLEKDALAGNMERVRSDIVRIVESTERMQALLRDLLELSRIGRLKNQSELIPFNAIVEDALKLVEGQVEAQKPSIHTMPDMPPVYGDRLRLVEVMQNLLDNAIKFSTKADPSHIDIGVRADDYEQVFFVRDNGIGIAPEFHERVFGLFNKLDPSIEGTGIGLTLVKRIIEIHGGRIWIESTGNGTGATFCFTLGNRAPV
jgi:PAS domain S-box-containing protein